jgi:tripartite-type tricarboxylate transporter receptor subunit TctC
VKSGTPAAIVTQLNKVMVEILADKDIQRRLLEMGIVADPTSPDDLTTFIKTDIAKWADVIARNKIEQR